MSISSIIRVVADEAQSISGQVSGITDGAGTGSTVADAIGATMNAVYIAIGVVAVIIIIIGGVNYSTSQGEPVKVKKAKDTILYATIGLVVTVLAFALTQFIIGSVNGQ